MYTSCARVRAFNVSPALWIDYRPPCSNFCRVAPRRVTIPAYGCLSKIDITAFASLYCPVGTFTKRRLSFVCRVGYSDIKGGFIEIPILFNKYLNSDLI